MKNNTFFNTFILPMAKMGISNNHNVISFKINNPEGDTVAVAIGLFYELDINAISILYSITKKDTLIEEEIRDNIDTLYYLWEKQNKQTKGKLQPNFVKTRTEAVELLNKEVMDTLTDNNIGYKKVI